MSLLYSNLDGSIKSVVVFIHGFRKDSSTWNRTDSGKVIGIEESVRKVASTVLVDLKNDDYVRPIHEVSVVVFDEILSKVSKISKIIIVAHSYGAFYAISIAKLYPQRIHALLLLDPTAKTESYRNYLIKDGSDIQAAKLRNFDALPDSAALNPKIIVKVYLKVDLSEGNDDMIDKLSYFDKFTKVNLNSDIIMCPNRSHMLHYDMPDKFITVVKQLVKLI